MAVLDRLVPSLLVLVFATSSSTEGTCIVESVRCDFPFTRNGEVHYSCLGEERQEELENPRYFCYSQIGEKYVAGQCNGGCFDEDGGPSVFNSSMGDDVLSFFCKTDPSPCQFPFIWQNREYRECTTDGSEFPWCAVEVDENRNLVDNRWGKCNMDTCDPTSDYKAEEEIPGPESITLTFPELSGELLLSQLSASDSLTVEGQLQGDLGNNSYLVDVYSGTCQAPGEIFRDIQTVRQQDGFLQLNSQSRALSLYSDENSALGKVIIITEFSQELLGEGEQQEGPGRRVACTVIQKSNGLDTTTLIIIILCSIIALLVFILLVVICCCCCRNRRREKKKNDPGFDSIDDPIGNGRARTPLYDELSIPFIDASLPPTPKMGRSTDQLAILLGRGSKTSLSSVGKVDATPI